MLFQKKSLFAIIHLCTHSWQLKIFDNAARDCLEEHFTVCNFLCINLFDNLTKMVDIHDLCLNCKRHFLNAISIRFHCFLQVKK